jgi:hypothetical protein
MKHWASSLIGKPWTEAHNCWWLFRQAWARRWGDGLPTIATEEPPGPAAIRDVARAGRARRVSGPPCDGDAVVMRSSVELHIGMAVCIGNRLGVLDTVKGSCARWLPWDVATRGYEIELWRCVE